MYQNTLLFFIFILNVRSQPRRLETKINLQIQKQTINKTEYVKYMYMFQDIFFLM